MLAIYAVIIETVGMLRADIERIERRDPDLARQLRRAASSIALNVAEGEFSQGRNRLSRYHNALGSARETKACLDVAVALGYLDAIAADLDARLRQITGTLVRLVRARKG